MNLERLTKPKAYQEAISIEAIKYLKSIKPGILTKESIKSRDTGNYTLEMQIPDMLGRDLGIRESALTQSRTTVEASYINS